MYRILIFSVCMIFFCACQGGKFIAKFDDVFERVSISDHTFLIRIEDRDYVDKCLESLDGEDHIMLEKFSAISRGREKAGDFNMSQRLADFGVDKWEWQIAVNPEGRAIMSRLVFSDNPVSLRTKNRIEREMLNIKFTTATDAHCFEYIRSSNYSLLFFENGVIKKSILK